ncbi:hypothetical protein HOH87_08270 [bacterium]|jgi:hypothetical protein|nr:hypothetical protein [bacterium]
MKQFTTKLIFLLVSLLLWFLLLEGLSRQLFLSKSDLNIKLNYLEDKKSSTEILVFGHSQMEAAVSPSELDAPSYNLAFNSQDFYYDHQLFSRYQDIPSLTTVMLGLSWFSLGYDESEKAMHLVTDYYREAKIKPANGPTILYLLSYSTFYKNRAKFLQTLPDLFKKLPSPSLSNKLASDGSRVRTYTPLSHSEWIAHSQQRAKYHQSIYSQSLESQTLSRIEAILSVADKKNLCVLLFTPPYPKAYRDGFPDNWKSDFDKKLLTLKRKYPSIHVLDHSALEGFNQEDYRDGDHLNEKGAIKFSQILNQDLGLCSSNPKPRL